MKVAIRDIHANPFRHIDRYPIREDKIAALVESITTTGFWDNLVARQTADGQVQIAYGHHRREALRRTYAPYHQIDLILRDLDDEQMLKIMARENMEEWGSSAAVEHETVAAVVQAYAAGQIELEAPSQAPGATRSSLRYAPSFIAGNSPAEQEVGVPPAPYTARTVARFLGWTYGKDEIPQDKVHDALNALELIERGYLSEDAFVDLTSHQARQLIEHTRRNIADAEREAREAERQAREAERQREQAAERHRREQEDAQRRAEQAAKARDEQQRRQREHEAREAERRAEEQQRRQEAARERAEAARQRQEAAARQAKHTAGVTSREVGATFRSGGGSRDAAARAAELRPKADQPPPDIDVHARTIAGKVHDLFTADHHPLARQLDELVKFRKYLDPSAARNLALELRNLAGRVEHYGDRLLDEQPATPGADPNLEILEGEVVDQQ